jgi:hypothetical protein
MPTYFVSLIGAALLLCALGGCDDHTRDPSGHQAQGHSLTQQQKADENRRRLLENTHNPMSDIWGGAEKK